MFIFYSVLNISNPVVHKKINLNERINLKLRFWENRIQKSYLNLADFRLEGKEYLTTTRDYSTCRNKQKCVKFSKR